MYTHSKGHKYYEDLYDRLTVEAARRHMISYDDFYVDFEKKLPKNDAMDRPGNAVLVNMFYMQTVGDELLHRFETREQHISDWINQDEAKDLRIAHARLKEEPYCNHCGKQGLRIIDKSLMSRGKTYKSNDLEEVLLMLKCTHCNKNSAFWEDGAVWKVKPDFCPKCSAEVTHISINTDVSINFTFTCPSCGHSHKDKIRLGESKKKKLDPDYKKDRAHFCLEDKEWRDKLFEIRRGFIEIVELGKKFKEREVNEDIYEAVKEMKKPKIAELSIILAQILEKAGYIEFSLDKPQVGRDVFVGFSCLDGRSEREEYVSQKMLKKLIKESLSETNWRLMSEGISYRLGYLSGRLRAYECEEDLKELVTKVREDTNGKKR